MTAGARLPPRPAALDAAAVATELRKVQGWQVRHGRLEKSFDFADFHRTMAFVNAVAWVAHAADHHPRIELSYARCTLSWCTDSASALTMNDFICASRVDALLA